MMVECEVSMISKYEEQGLLVLSSDQNEKQTQTVCEEVNENSVTNPRIEAQTVDEEVSNDSIIDIQNEKQTVEEEEVNGEEDENSVMMNTDDESGEGSSEEEQIVEADWMNESEYPPLVSRGFPVVVERGQSTTSWLDALKKPHCSFEAKVKVNGEKLDHEFISSSEGSSRANLRDAKVDVSSDSHEGSVASSEICSVDELVAYKAKSVASSEICSADELVAYKANGLSTETSSSMSTLFTIKIPRFDDEVLKEQTRLAELDVDEKTSLRDDIRLQMDRRIQENGCEHADKVRSARESVKPEIETNMKEDLSIEKEEDEEEMERKVEELIGEDLEADKREKKRQKRLRLKERKKAAAVARDGFSLDPNEVEKTKTHESQDEASSSSPNVQHQTDLLKLVEGNNEAMMAQQREKRRNKKMTRKERKKAMTTTTTTMGVDKSKMKWILIIFVSLTLLLCLTNVDHLQLLRQILH